MRSPTDPPAHYLVNANSLGLRIQFGKTVFLLPGDIQAEDQVRALLPSVPHEKLKCDVLIAPGHGIHAPLQFAAVTRPEVTLCSVFPRYARGLAARKTYAGIGSQVFVTRLTRYDPGRRQRKNLPSHHPAGRRCSYKLRKSRS